MWRLCGFALTATIFVVGCSAGSDDGGDGTDGAGTDPAGAEASPLESDAVDPDATEATGAADPEPEPLFTATNPPELNPAGQRFDMRDATADSTGSITLIGDFIDYDERVRSARLVIGAETDDHTVIDLPSDSTAAGAHDAEYLPGGELLVGGWQRRAGVAVPTLWEEAAGDFTIVELPVNTAGGWVYDLASDGTAAIGETLVDGEQIDTMWIRGDDGWTQVDINPPPGAQRVSIQAVLRVDGDLVAVGYGWTDDSDAVVTGFWEIDPRTLTPTYRIPDGVNDGVALTGIAASPDGDGFVIVGGSGFTDSEPVVYHSDDYEVGGGTWSSRSVSIDTDGRFTGEGIGLGQIEVGGGRMIAWTWSSFTRQVIESADGGRTWSQLGLLASDSGGSRVVSGGVVTADLIVAGSGAVVDRWDGDDWRRFSGTWSESGEWTLADFSVLGTDDDFIIPLMVSRPTAPRGVYELRVLSSTDGVSWNDDQILAGGGRAQLATAQSGGQTWLFTTGTTFNNDPLNIWRFGDNGWAAANDRQAEPFIRSIPVSAVGEVDARDGSDGGALVVTYDFNADQSRIIPNVVSPDGTVADGDFGVERARSDTADISCLERLGDTFVVVLSEPDQPDLILTSADGLNWSTIAAEPTSAPVSGCHVVDDELLLTVGRGNNKTRVPMMLDGTVGQPLDLPTEASVSDFVMVDGVRVAVGWLEVDGAQTAGLWWETVDGWEQMALGDSGLTTDEFGQFSWASRLRVLDDRVVVVGGDGPGLVLWTADRVTFGERLGVDDG